MGEGVLRESLVWGTEDCKHDLARGPGVSQPSEILPGWRTATVVIRTVKQSASP